MKKLLFLLSVIVLFGCEKETFKLAPDAMISIRPAVGAWKSPIQKVKADEPTYQHLSAMEIVKQSMGISFQNEPIWGTQAVDRGFSESQRDTVSNPPCLKMYGADIIKANGNYDPSFIEATDCVLLRTVNNQRDTVGYIPNSVLRAAEIEINAAFSAKDNEAVYRVFNEAFTFLPVTGEEWRALKANSEN